MLVLTFDSPVLPSDVSAGYMKYRVRQFYPKPLQCFRCFQYGHRMKDCSACYPVCCPCDDIKHFVTKCVKAVKCINCGLDHATNDKECPK